MRRKEWNGLRKAQTQVAVKDVTAVPNADSTHRLQDIRADVQGRMSDYADILCNAKDVAQARLQAEELNKDIRRKGIRITRPSEAGRVLQWQQMALASEAVLAALDHYISEGGGSRGARSICDIDGSSLPESRSGSLPDVRSRPEREEDMQSQIFVRLQGDKFVITKRPNRSFDTNATSFFERDWPAWLTGEIFDLDEKDHLSC